ncbi:TonB-dependent receptor plug domain-containing protein [Opitutus terrae]|uniref:TonB-dependent receptor plug n=1 Tax=Opitutus terrae (strain DSM 11246 / JCM 15787 / PB90-1) TaxID=452637 RepID=B1ZU92_OPITP|nr:TonB-dependent receptor plug domain-containing protein [Opitutus terrae]ACB76654.1 TonB-dependent receptor plug [Opitutus terrae PB90-1]
MIQPHHPADLTPATSKRTLEPVWRYLGYKPCIPMKTPLRTTLGLLAVMATGPGLLAQTTAAPTPAPAEEADEVIQLSPFEVRAETDRGYAATQTLAGTRIRTNLSDVGSAISVVTRDFLTDVGATDSSTLLQYTTNAEVAGTRGTYAGLGNSSQLDETANLRSSGGAPNRVRGLAAADNTRDFFVTDIPWDSYNVERIEIQRGPNSILFGLGSPAGIVNASLRNAEFRNLGSVEARVASYGSFRASVDINQELIDDVLAIRLDGVWNDQKFQQDPAYQEDERFFGAIRFDPKLFNRRDFRTSIRAKFENGDIKANRPRIIPPNDAISPWFRARDPNSMFGGMAKLAVDNGYDSWRTDNIVVGSARGLIPTTSPNYQPWLAVPPNQQQPFWLLDGTTNQLYRVEGGWINVGARNNTGGFTGASNGLLGKRTGDQFYGLNNLPAMVSAAHSANAALFPDAIYGQYKNMSMLDPSIFNFYDTLLDGPTKWETENWNAYNIDFSQTMFDDRLGVQLSYDRQKYRRAGEALLGGSPTITMDIMKNFLDYYVSGANGTTTTNPNFGRPYVQGAGGGGTGSSYESERKYARASLFAELRASDVLDNKFLVKLLGRHRFNGVYADERYETENRGWQMYANSREWAGYWNGTDGSNSPITDRPPQAFIYLGSSVAGRDSATGAQVPGITADVKLNNAGVHVFDPTWLNFGIPFTNAAAGTTIPNWNVPANLWRVFNGQPIPASDLPQPNTVPQLTEASNPANYVGWTYFQDDLMRYNNGADDALLTNAQKSLRVTKSYAASWQGFFWNDAIVPTFGWRYDEVKGKGVSAPRVSGNRNILNVQPNTYMLPNAYPTNQIFKDHSTAGGVVVHLNRLLERDFLPINVSLSYNKSSNFQVTDVRRNVWGQPIANPTGSTKDYGVLLSTKDNRFTFRAVKYETSVAGATTDMGNPGSVGAIVQQGMRWRNVFLYKLSAYDWANRNNWATRNTWSGQTVNPQNPAVTIGADASLTPEQGRALEDAAITKWNEAQTWMTERGFFDAWGFQPQSVGVLTDRTTYENAAGGPTALDPASQYAPNPASIFAYTATAPQGFAVTSDTLSKGYEFEFTANPLPNWRISFNASKTTATRSNVGGPELDEYVNYIDELMAAPIGSFNGTNYILGNMPQFGNPGLSLLTNVWNNWRGNYAQLKLNENSDSAEVRKWRYNFVTNYTFREGKLRGLGVGGSYRWQDKVIIGYPVVATDPTRPNFDFSKPYYGPSEDAIDLWVSYERKLTNKINWRIQLNVYNVGNNEELIPISVQPDGKTWASVRIAPVQEWTVTNTFSF